MALSDLLNKNNKSRAPGLAGLAAATSTKKTKSDLTTVEGLADKARSLGYEDEVGDILDETPKLSFLQRLGKGLGAFNPAEAILTGVEKDSVGAGVAKYGKGIAQAVGSAVTGTDYEGERRDFSDVAEKLGVENGIAKFGIGFLGDVLLDPSTYFGGALARGLTAGTKLATKGTLKAVGKVAPEVEQGLLMAGKGAKDAFGKAFVAGYGSSKGALDDVLTFMSKKNSAEAGLATSNLNRMGTGVLTKEQQEELAAKLIAGKREEFLAREAGQGADEAVNIAGDIGVEESLKGVTDPAVKELILQQQARSKKFAGQLGLENPYESYFPFLKKDKIQNFLQETSAKNLRVGSEGYKKEFKNLLTNAEIETDPVKAFFTSEAQQVSDRMTRDFLKGFSKKYGKSLESFANADEAQKAGFKVLKEKGLFGKEVGYIKEGDARVLNNLISPEFQTVNMLAKATGFDALTNLFKRSVTGLFLPFHVRNFASGMIQNFEALGPAALNPKSIAAGQKMAYLLAKGEKPGEGLIQVAGKNEKFSKVFKAFEERFGGDTFYHNDFLQAIDNGEGALRQAQGALSKGAARSTLGFQKGNMIPLVGNDGIPFKMARVVGQFIEHQQKATAYMAALSQGKTVSEALRIAATAGFDYRALTAFESQIMRRIIPFYSFTRKNIELQLKTLGENPQRINQVLSFFENMGDNIDPDEKKSLPQYLADSIGIKISDTPEGLKQYISSFGTPIEAFADLFNRNPVLKGISQMNPLLKAPIEIGIGKDSFRQRDLKDVYDAREYKNAPQIVKDILDIREIEKDVLKEQPDGKLKKVGTRTEYRADPKRLLIARSLFTSRGATYLDQIFGDDLKGGAKALKLTTGIKPQQVDLELQKGLKERDRKRALEDILLQTGEVAQFRRLFEPKDE